MYKDGKTRIIDATRKIISETGINGATTRAIAREAGMTTGAIYHYYQSKEDIFYDVMDQSLSVSTLIANKAVTHNYAKEDIITDLREGTRQRFYKIADNHLQFYLANEAMMGDQELHKRFVKKYDEWISRTEEIIINLYDFTPTYLNRAIATLLIAAIDGVVMQLLIGTKMVAIDEIIAVWDLMLRKGLPELLSSIPPNKTAP